MHLDPAAIAAGARLEAHDVIGSTNAEARARACAGERGPLWIVARRQTAGRGRRGRAWVSEPGNLYATLLVTDPAPPERAATLSFVAALAVVDAVAAVAPSLSGRLGLKWPNDVLLDGAKLAGILIEGESGGGVPLAVAIGIGVNCAHHPRPTPMAATDLAAAGVAVGPERLFGALSRAMAERLARWDAGSGFAAIRADWLARAAGLGTDIRVALGERIHEGRFDGLGPEGHLILAQCDGTTLKIAAGDVFPLHRREEPGEREVVTAETAIPASRPAATPVANATKPA